ncbi:tRNA pseudouridine(55) synthase TruB [Bacteroidota bacterium]
MTDEFGGIQVLGRHDGFEHVKEGVAVLVDKPKGWSSFKVISLLRSRLGIKKIGHAGTLDPMATGLLICCVGRAATRHIDRFVGLTKEYTGVMRLGESTASYDAESDIVARVPAGHIRDEDVILCFRQLSGEQQQIPPMYSAIKIGGRRLYKIARRGETVERPSRHVRIDAFDFTGRMGDDLSFRVICSKGTYIRSLANDAGQMLGVGAHLVELRRTKIGCFGIEDALTTDEISAT